MQMMFIELTSSYGTVTYMVVALHVIGHAHSSPAPGITSDYCRILGVHNCSAGNCHDFASPLWSLTLNNFFMP